MKKIIPLKKREISRSGDHSGHVQRESKVENESRKWRNARGHFKITNNDYALQ